MTPRLSSLLVLLIALMAGGRAKAANTEKRKLYVAEYAIAILAGGSSRSLSCSKEDHAGIVSTMRKVLDRFTPEEKGLEKGLGDRVSETLLFKSSSFVAARRRQLRNQQQDRRQLQQEWFYYEGSGSWGCGSACNPNDDDDDLGGGRGRDLRSLEVPPGIVKKLGKAVNDYVTTARGHCMAGRDLTVDMVYTDIYIEEAA